VAREFLLELAGHSGLQPLTFVTDYIRLAGGASNGCGRSERMSENGNIVTTLANIFRGFSLVFGISAPPPDQDQRQFVMLWLGIIVLTILFFVGVLFGISHLHVG
jgi:hypothetical protein